MLFFYKNAPGNNRFKMKLREREKRKTETGGNSTRTRFQERKMPLAQKSANGIQAVMPCVFYIKGLVPYLTRVTSPR